MAETLKLDVRPRTVVRKANKQLRREGQVPVHIFGHGVESQAMQAEERNLRQVMRQAGTSGLIQVNVDGSAHNVMVREVQRHPVTGRLVHVDLYQVRMDVKTRVRLPLVFVGEAPGVSLHDGVVLHLMEAINVEALPGDLPHHIEVDISGLEELDQALHVSDMVVPGTVTILDDAEEMVVKIQPPRKVEEEVVTEEAAAEAAGEAPTEAGEGASSSEAAPSEE